MVRRYGANGTADYTGVYRDKPLRIALDLSRKPFVYLLNNEYAQDAEQVTLELKYSGGHFDPLTSDNLLSLKIAQNAAESISYAQIQEDEWTNRVTVRIR